MNSKLLSGYPGVYLTTNGEAFRGYGMCHNVPSEINDEDVITMVDCVPPVYYLMKDFETEEEGIEWCLLFNETEVDDEK